MILECKYVSSEHILSKVSVGDALSLIRSDKIRELLSPWVPITLLNSPGSFLQSFSMEP